jgi:hypothetical protein
MKRIYLLFLLILLLAPAQSSLADSDPSCTIVFGCADDPCELCGESEDDCDSGDYYCIEYSDDSDRGGIYVHFSGSEVDCYYDTVILSGDPGNVLAPGGTGEIFIELRSGPFERIGRIHIDFVDDSYRGLFGSDGLSVVFEPVPNVLTPPSKEVLLKDGDSGDIDVAELFSGVIYGNAGDNDYASIDRIVITATGYDEFSINSITLYKYR